MPKTASKKPSFEEAMARLEEVVARLEDKSTPLEEAMRLYKEGVELSAFCDGRLKEAEQQVLSLRQREENIVTEPFMGGGNGI